MDLGLSRKKAVIVGASRGIGRAIASLLADEGADLAICARHHGDVDEAVRDLQRRGGKAFGAAVDVRDKEAYQGWIARAGDHLGGIDIFIPCASAGSGVVGEEAWQANLDIDVLGATRGIDAAMPFLKHSSAAAVVVISSVAAFETFPFFAPWPYNAMKAALIAHAKQLSQVLAAKGVRVNTVSPGPIYFEGGVWEHVKDNLPTVYDGAMTQMPIGRLGRPEEVANAVAFIASPAARLITGANLVVDGGFSRREQF